jgi:hypothetical protein
MLQAMRAFSHRPRALANGQHPLLPGGIAGVLP